MNNFGCKHENISQYQFQHFKAFVERKNVVCGKFIRVKKKFHHRQPLQNDDEIFFNLSFPQREKLFLYHLSHPASPD